MWSFIFKKTEFVVKNYVEARLAMFSCNVIKFGCITYRALLKTVFVPGPSVKTVDNSILTGFNIAVIYCGYIRKCEKKNDDNN